MRLAFVDVETTGGRAQSDRITEIAVKLLENGQVVGEWQSLVDPECSIPPFIQSLTGIDNSMVRAAPVFAALADELEELTKDAVFVAHNARFDYAFFKAEFRRLNRSFNRRVLCTVKLAKALYPQHKGHGLDALIQRHSISVSVRHRAMADVEATVAFFEIAREEHSNEVFQKALAKQFKKPSLPKGLTEAQVNAIPDTAGVYRFYGENDALLYVGKSVNLYQRVMSHFSSDHSSNKEMTLAQSITHLDWTETTGDIGAQLLELKQIKTLNPIYNRRSRASKTLVTLELCENDQGFLTAKLSREFDSKRLERFYGVYRNQSAAQRALLAVAQKNDLCRKLLGLEQGAGACFGYHTSSCKGACVGEEDATLYNLRMQIAFHELQLKAWPFEGVVGLKEKHPSKDWTQIHLIYNWCHLGTVESEAQLADVLANTGDDEALCAAFDLDTYKLLSKTILAPKPKLPIIDFGKRQRGQVAQQKPLSHQGRAL